MNRLRNVLVLGGFLLVAAAVAGVLEPHVGRSATASGSTISVTGQASVKAVPDHASFDFGVSVQAATAAAALSQNASQAHAIIAALRKSGVAGSDIQTTEISLYPRTADHGRRIVGYTASNSVEASVQLTQAGPSVDAAVRAGATQVGGPNLTVSDLSSFRDRALKQALADAKAKAATIASGGGLTLGAIVRVTESAQTPQYYAAGTFAAAVPARISIEPGTQQIQATVRVTYSAGG
jgi:uncharacterized protein